MTKQWRGSTSQLDIRQSEYKSLVIQYKMEKIQNYVSSEDPAVTVQTEITVEHPQKSSVEENKNIQLTPADEQSIVVSVNIDLTDNKQHQVMGNKLDINDAKNKICCGKKTGRWLEFAILVVLIISLVVCAGVVIYMLIINKCTGQCLCP